MPIFVKASRRARAYTRLQRLRVIHNKIQPKVGTSNARQQQMFKRRVKIQKAIDKEVTSGFKRY